MYELTEGQEYARELVREMLGSGIVCHAHFPDNDKLDLVQTFARRMGDDSGYTIASRQDFLWAFGEIVGKVGRA